MVKGKDMFSAKEMDQSMWHKPDLRPVIYSDSERQIHRFFLGNLPLTMVLSRSIMLSESVCNSVPKMCHKFSEKY